MCKQSYAETEKGFAWQKNTLRETPRRVEESFREEQLSVQMASWKGT